MRKEDLKDWTMDRLKDEIVNLSDKNFNLEWRIKQFEESEGRWKCEIESLRTEKERLNVDNAAYSSANSMYKEHLEECEQKNKHLFETNGKLEAENKALKQRIKDLENVCDARCFLDGKDLIESLKKHMEDDICISDIPFDDSEIDYDALIAELQGQHQQDCIRINDLTTTVHVLAGLYSTLRKTVGMD